MKGFDAVKAGIGKSIKDTENVNKKYLAQELIPQVYPEHIKQTEVQSRIDELVIRIYTTAIADLYMEILFPPSTVNSTVSWMDTKLEFFKVKTRKDLESAMPGGWLGRDRKNGIGLNKTWKPVANAPKFAYYGARLFRVAAKKYLRLQEPERAKEAYATAMIYIQACIELLKRHKETVHDMYKESLHILMFDIVKIPEKYSNIDFERAVENEFEISEAEAERLKRTIDNQSAKHLEKGE